MLTELELDRAALEIARIERPDLDANFWIAELDRHAFAIAERAGDLTDGRRFVDAANAYLFGELGLAGNEEDFYNPENSCLDRVLETGRGIPISLSAIYMEIARRLAKPVYGVGLPAHFIVRYDDGRYSTFIDPFAKGALLDMEGCCRLIGADSIPPEILAPASRSSIILRMLNNLRQIYFTRQDSARALQVLDLLISISPDVPDEHKQRGTVLMQLKRMTESLAAFRRYLELSPDAADREQVEEHAHNLALWIASRN